MKTKTEIEEELKSQSFYLIENMEKHSKLNQIDMLSGEGNTLRESINKTKGFINALKWVLKND